MCPASFEIGGVGVRRPFSTTTALADRARGLGATLVQYVAVKAVLTHGSKVTGVRTADDKTAAPVDGRPLRLHRHQAEAVRVARSHGPTF